MTTNTELAGDTTGDTRSDAFRELRRRARATKKRAQQRKTGGRGSAQPAQPQTSIDPQASKNLQQKDLPAVCPQSDDSVPAPESTPILPPPEVISVTAAITREDNWRSRGEIQATIAGRSINPRVLEILLPSGERGRAIVRPSEHQKFGFRKPVWVRKDDRGKHWLVVGRYSQWGVRCE